MNTLTIWIFWLYIVPMIALILLMLSEGYNPFTKENAKIVFIPVINLYYFLLEYALAFLFFLISWGEFFEDVGKSFKERFL
jgi:hypothetical protein